MSEGEPSVSHPTCPYAVVVPLSRGSLESASEVRIRILDAEIRGGAPKDLWDIYAEHNPNPCRRILKTVLPVHLHVGRKRDEVRNRGNPHPEISHRLLIAFKRSTLISIIEIVVHNDGREELILPVVSAPAKLCQASEAYLQPIDRQIADP